jgi:hypothetical protein
MGLNGKSKISIVLISLCLTIGFVLAHYEYKEIPNTDHGSIINACLPAVYEFFEKYSKK